MNKYFAGKPKAREAVWNLLQAERVARFPYPPHGRIPNFEGAKKAAERLFSIPAVARARRIKVNPDAPQRPVRALALERGITVYVPTPRLRAGFMMLDPNEIPRDALRHAASVSKTNEWARAVALDDLPDLDLIVVGSVAVTRDGYRCGKGDGYADIEFAVWAELGHPPPPVATTIHPLQFVDFFPAYEHDVPLSWIATPNDLIQVDNPPPAPRGIEWSRLAPERIRETPILRELAARRR